MSMGLVRVKTSELVKILKSNRQKHVKEFDKARKEYRIALTNVLERIIKKAKAGEDVPHRIGLDKPKSYVEDYDRTIRMLELSTDKKVELTQQEFQQYVQDQWVWKRGFDFSNSLIGTGTSNPDAILSVSE